MNLSLFFLRLKCGYSAIWHYLDGWCPTSIGQPESSATLIRVVQTHSIGIPWLLLRNADFRAPSRPIGSNPNSQDSPGTPRPLYLWPVTKGNRASLTATCSSELLQNPRSAEMPLFEAAQSPVGEVSLVGYGSRKYDLRKLNLPWFLQRTSGQKLSNLD